MSLLLFIHMTVHILSLIHIFVSKSGRYGGTFAHSDIAFEFTYCISAEFKLYIIKDYKIIKSNESSCLSFNWNFNRKISKLNFRIHTDAIKEN